MKKYLAVILILTTMFASLPICRNYMGLLASINAVGNTIHGWEVKRNNLHKQPEIPEAASEMLKKYNAVYVGDPDKKVIYLTIDLGYESGNTEKILDVLKRNNVKATFFITASYLNKNPRIVDRVVKEGHSLQNHTVNYKHLNQLGQYQVKREIMDMHQIIYKKYGLHMKYLRLPYEEWSEKVMEVAKETGYKTVFWSIACVDWVEGKDASYIYNNIMNNHHNGAIILLHGVNKSSPTAIDMIIRGLKEKGYELRTLGM